MGQVETSKLSVVALGTCVMVLVLIIAVAWPESSRAGGGHSDYAVSVSRSGSGQGTVTSQPSGISCGTDCDGSFSLGTMVQLTAEPAPGSRFAGWTGACSGVGACTVSSPPDGLPVSVGAQFDKAAKPTVRFLSNPVPRLTRVRVGCGDGPPCSLRVTVLLRIWLSKKGYDYYKASSTELALRDGVIHRDLAMRNVLLSGRLKKAIPGSGRRVQVKVLVRDVDTGTQVAINRSCFCGKHPCGTQ
jgi:hypothetical protein